MKTIERNIFLWHLQTVDGINFATTTMASETSVSEVIVNIPLILMRAPVPPISTLETGLYKSCEIISGKTTSSHVHETAPPQLWYWGYGGERKVQQIAIINLVAKFLPSTVLSRMRLIGFNKVAATKNWISCSKKIACCGCEISSVNCLKMRQKLFLFLLISWGPCAWYLDCNH